MVEVINYISRVTGIAHSFSITMDALSPDTIDSSVYINTMYNGAL